MYTAADTLRGCLAKGGCKFVPGLSQQQREFSLIAVTSGGFLFGAVARGGVSAWTWVFCAIWVPWVGMFGFYPVRQAAGGPDPSVPKRGNIRGHRGGDGALAGVWRGGDAERAERGSWG